MRAAALLAVVLLSACAQRPPPDAHVPPFARVPYEPISRAAVVAIALREWRLFGAPVDDAPPGSYRPATPEDKPERQQGLWQRVGEYWWLAMNAGDPDAGWTGKHDANGVVFPANEDGTYAWSAAFVSYVMRIAGAGSRFPYSASHSDYIDIAADMAAGRTSGWLITAERPASVRAATGRPDLPRPRQRARSPLRRSAGRALPRALRHRGGHLGAGSDRRGRRQRRRRGDA